MIWKFILRINIFESMFGLHITTDMVQVSQSPESKAIVQGFYLKDCINQIKSNVIKPWAVFLHVDSL